MNAKVGTSVEWEIAEAIWRGLTLSPRLQRDRADVHEAARLCVLLLGTLLFLSTSATLARAYKVGKSMTHVAVTDCAVAAVDVTRAVQRRGGY